MQKNRRISRSFSESGMHEFKRQVQYKSQFRGRRVVEAGRTILSSKLCSCCGHKKADLALSDRTYRCYACGHEADRDYNASLNLLHYLEEQVGAVRPELTPVDLTALLSDFELNRVATSDAEAGTQLKSYA